MLFGNLIYRKLLSNNIPQILPNLLKSNLKPNRVFFGIHFHFGGNVVHVHPFPGFDFMVVNFWIAVESTHKNVVELVFEKSSITPVFSSLKREVILHRLT